MSSNWRGKRRSRFELRRIREDEERREAEATDPEHAEAAGAAAASNEAGPEPVSPPPRIIWQITSEDDWLHCTDPEPMLKFLATIGIAGDHRLCWLLAHAFLQRTELLVNQEECRIAANYCRRRAEGLAGRENLPDGWAWDVSSPGEVPSEFLAVYRAVNALHEAKSAGVRLWGGGLHDLVPWATLHALSDKGPSLEPVTMLVANAWRCGATEPTWGFPDDMEWEGDGDDPEVAWPDPAVPRDEERFDDEWEIRLFCRARRHQAMIIRDVVGNPFRTIEVRPQWRTSAVVRLAREIRQEEERHGGFIVTERMPQLVDQLIAAGCDCDEVLDHCRAEARPHVYGCWLLSALAGTADEEPS